MTDSSSSGGDGGGTDDGVNRRTVLKTAGVGAVAGVGLVGTASAHEVEGPPVFCGCEELCVCVEGNADVLVARETDGGGYDVGFVVGGGDLDPYPQGEPYYSGHFCVSTDDPEVPDDGKIIGLQVAGNRWVNPNPCAQEALAAEQRQLDSTHPRPVGKSGDVCGTPPCEDAGGGDGDIEVTWEDCETVRVTGSDEGLDAIVVNPIRCFPDGPCPDGVPGGRTIEDPELPLTIDDRYLTADGDEVPYYISGIELEGDVEQSTFSVPPELDCGFPSKPEIEVTWEDCETVTLAGPDGKLDKIELYLQRCFDDPGLGCPDGQIVTIENPQLPLTLGREELATDGEEYRIDAVDLFGDVVPDDATPPDDLDCSFDSEGDVDVTWEDCETVRVTGSEERLDEIIVHPIRCFPDGPCPDGVPGGRSIEDPDLPLTIDDRYLAVDEGEYYIAAIELRGDVEPNSFAKPDDLDCEFDSSPEIEVTWEDCETVTLTGPDEDLEKIELYLQRCFDDPGLGCPDGQIVTIEDPDLPLTLGRAELATDGEEYRIDAVDLFGDVTPDDATPPDDLDCSFESANDEQNMDIVMDDETVTLGAEEGALSEVTITGSAEFSYAGWRDDGPVGHVFITSWARSDADIDFPDRDVQRYFDVDGDSDIVRKDIEITFDVPPAVGDPAPGEAIETEIEGRVFYGLERGSDPQDSENIGDWREGDAMTLRVQRDAANDAAVTWRGRDPSR